MLAGTLKCITTTVLVEKNKNTLGPNVSITDSVVKCTDFGTESVLKF